MPPFNVHHHTCPRTRNASPQVVCTSKAAFARALAASKRACFRSHFACPARSSAKHLRGKGLNSTFKILITTASMCSSNSVQLIGNFEVPQYINSTQLTSNFMCSINQSSLTYQQLHVLNALSTGSQKINAHLRSISGGLPPLLFWP